MESEGRSVVSDSLQLWTIQSVEFSRPEYWNGQPFPSPGDLPNPGIKPRSPTLQVDSLSAEPQANPLQIEVFLINVNVSSEGLSPTWFLEFFPCLFFLRK